MVIFSDIFLLEVKFYKLFLYEFYLVIFNYIKLYQ